MIYFVHPVLVIVINMFLLPCVECTPTCNTFPCPGFRCHVLMQCALFVCPTDVDGHAFAGHIIGVIHQVCTDWSRETPHLSEPEDPVILSIQSIRNGRRKMEDRHVVCTDVNALFCLKVGLKWSGHADL